MSDRTPGARPRARWPRCAPTSRPRLHRRRRRRSCSDRWPAPPSTASRCSRPQRATRRHGRRRVAALVRLFALGDAVTPARLAAALPTLGVDGPSSASACVREQGTAGVRAACDLRPYGDEQHGVVGRLRPRPRSPPASRCARTTCSASAAPRRPSRRGPPRPPVEPRARPRHRVRRAGAAPRRARPHGHRHRPVRAGAGLRPVQRRAQRRRRGTLLLGGACSIPLRGSSSSSSSATRPSSSRRASTEVPLYEYRDGGPAGDAFVADLVRSARRRTSSPGGIAQFLGNWEVGARRRLARAGGAVARRHRAGRVGDPARRAGPRASTPRRGPATAGTSPAPTPSTRCMPRG